MTAEQALAALNLTLPAMVEESKTTRRVLAAVPDDKGDYKPHEKNMSALELVQHITFSDIWFLSSIVQGEFSQPDDSGLAALNTPGKVLAVYDEKIPALLETVKGLSGEHLSKDVKFFTWNYPLVVYLQFALSHSIHHRGQLSVYLRPMGAKVPSIYGGSADEPMSAATEA